MKWLYRRPVRVALCCFPLVLLLYLAAYLVWTREFAWRSGDVWSFYPPPAGLMNLTTHRYRLYGRTRWEGWQRLEKIPATVFRPCLWADETLTGRTYLPHCERSLCFN